MVADQIELHEALGGDSDAVLIAHDWGTVGAWGAAAKGPERWRRAVILNIPPFAIFGENIVKYDQIKRWFYFWYFQMQRACEDVIRGMTSRSSTTFGRTGPPATTLPRIWSWSKSAFASRSISRCGVPSRSISGSWNSWEHNQVELATGTEAPSFQRWGEG